MPKWTQTDIAPNTYGHVSFGTDTDQSVTVDPWQLDSSGVQSFAAPNSATYDTTLARSGPGQLAVNGFPIGMGANMVGAGVDLTGTTAESVLAAGLTVPATFTAPIAYRFVAWGTITTTVDTQTVELRLRYGGLTGTQLFDFGAQQPNGSGVVTGVSFRVQFDIVFTSTTNVAVSAQNALNNHQSSVGQASNTVAAGTAEQLVVTCQNSANAVIMNCTGFFCERIA